MKLVLKTADIPPVVNPETPPGAILAIEGGDPLDGKPDRVNEFYRMGVRIITVVHYRNNELGDVMAQYGSLHPGPYHDGLTQAGRKVVERMQELGMVVDVAHAHPKTLRDIAGMNPRPLLDSHTSLCPSREAGQCGRQRKWQDMERIAKTGGVVCTWPMAFNRSGQMRRTFSDWARETLEMKKRLGIDHVGLGTDGGGNIPRLIEGYRDAAFHRDADEEIRRMLGALSALVVGLGGLVALRRGEHMRMTAVVASAKPAMRAYLDLVATSAALAFLVLILEVWILLLHRRIGRLLAATQAPRAAACPPSDRPPLRECGMYEARFS